MQSEYKNQNQSDPISGLALSIIVAVVLVFNCFVVIIRVLSFFFKLSLTAVKGRSNVVQLRAHAIINPLALFSSVDSTKINFFTSLY